MGVYIFDIDGTLSDAEHRLHFIEQDPPDWDSFFINCPHDPVISHTAELCFQLGIHHHIVMITGRSEVTRNMTKEWLDRNGIPCHDLLMRSETDRRPDWITKKELFENSDILPGEVLGVFEDRNKVVGMWREIGLPCYQVCDGDY